MNLSATIWSGLERLRAAGMPQVAAAIGNRIGRDRHFSVDTDGHWINRQAGATFVSPDIHAQRLAFVTDKVRDEWYWGVEPSGIVFDVGAGIGEETLVMAPLATHVYAIEAHPDVYACLVKTVEQSGLTNVTPIHCALADKDGEVWIASGEHHLASSIGSGSGIPVPARSLQSICAEHGVDQVDFLKMNIEGAERLAIQGFGDVPIRSLAIACHDFIPGDFMRTRELVRDWLEVHGYAVRQRVDDRRPWTRNNLYAKRR